MIERRREHCTQCGFDSELYDQADTISSQPIIANVLRAAIEGLEPDVLAARPNEQTWSIGEYLNHVREVAFGNRFAIEAAFATPGVVLDSPADDPAGLGDVQLIDVDRALVGIEREYGALRELLAGLTDERWHASVVLDGDPTPVGWFARHVLHDGLHHLGDIGRIRYQLGFGAATETGTVAQINMSGGGVPKKPVASAMVGPGGVDGDSQADRHNHGRPAQAVCVWSADVIAALQADGHPIAAGSAGENITVAGIDWASLRPGARMAIGDVSMLISAHAIPCAKNAQWFSDRDFNRILHPNNPGFSRLYAIPLGSGLISVGDSVVVEPTPTIAT